VRVLHVAALDAVRFLMPVECHVHEGSTLLQLQPVSTCFHGCSCTLSLGAYHFMPEVFTHPPDTIYVVARDVTYLALIRFCLPVVLVDGRPTIAPYWVKTFRA